MSIISSLKRQAQRPVRTSATSPQVKETKTYWNGEFALCRRVVVQVGTIERPTWWCAGMEGTERHAVEVRYYDQKFYLDNETGSAWLKVTEGFGGPEWGHKSLPDDSTVIREDV